MRWWCGGEGRTPDTGWAHAPNQRVTYLAPNNEFVTFKLAERLEGLGRALLPPDDSLETKRGCLVVLLHPKGVRCERAMGPTVVDRSAVPGRG
jgi:hypothetical protein